MIELAVLDMAGTTIDDGGAVYTALRDCVEAHGVTVPDDRLQQWMGTDKRTAIDALLGDVATPGLVEDAYADFTRRLEDAYLAEPPTPIDGVPEALKQLRADNVRVVLTTGFAHDVADPLLAAIGWTPGTEGSPVDAVVCADDVAAGRPAPYMIFRAMELAGVLSPTRVAVAGDTHVDVLAGSNAGATIVAGVLTGALSAEVLGTARHTHLLASVADLPALVRQH